MIHITELIVHFPSASTNVVQTQQQYKSFQLLLIIYGICGMQYAIQWESTQVQRSVHP